MQGVIGRVARPLTWMVRCSVSNASEGSAFVPLFPDESQDLY
jgi:hypothetical protein